MNNTINDNLVEKSYNDNNNDPIILIIISIIRV